MPEASGGRHITQWAEFEIAGAAEFPDPMAPPELPVAALPPVAVVAVPVPVLVPTAVDERPAELLLELVPAAPLAPAPAGRAPTAAEPVLPVVAALDTAVPVAVPVAAPPLAGVLLVPPAVLVVVELVAVAEFVVVAVLVAFEGVAAPEPDVAGSVTALPPTGYPLRCDALPTSPVVGVAVCAAAGRTPAARPRKIKTAARIMRLQRGWPAQVPPAACVAISHLTRLC